jgi:Ni/Fe-hydrogenase 1 B-type cytochrome subunit
MNTQFQQVYVWSKYLRFFHWTNVLAVTILLVLGLFIFNAKAFGVSVDGKILLKTIHVITGYVFATNLLLRLVMGFFGKGYERWRKTLPFAKGFTKELADLKQHPIKNTKVTIH